MMMRATRNRYLLESIPNTSVIVCASVHVGNVEIGVHDDALVVDHWISDVQVEFRSNAHPSASDAVGRSLILVNDIGEAIGAPVQRSHGANSHSYKTTTGARLNTFTSKVQDLHLLLSHQEVQLNEAMQQVKDLFKAVEAKERPRQR